jgi:hypothetical protein
MATFAVLDGINIINVILAESKEIAEEITGNTCLEYTTEIAEPGGTYENGIFKPIQPFPSWSWNNLTLQWEPPVPMPVGDGIEVRNWYWDEESQTWKE